VLAEVGRVLGVSRERVRQLETRALAKLGAHGGAPPPAVRSSKAPRSLRALRDRH
jgi:DNA-directed RNA polymerase sigma subunit (sigma70/sigma32)